MRVSTAHAELERQSTLLKCWIKIIYWWQVHLEEWCIWLSPWKNM